MAEQNNATCSICGKGYHMCLSCKDQIRLTPWKMHTCSAEHYKVYQIIHGLNTGVYDKAEAKARLENVDTSDMRDFRDNIRKIVKDIMKQGEAKQVVETPFVDESQQQSDVPTAVENTDTSEIAEQAVQKIRRRKAFGEAEAE